MAATWMEPRASVSNVDSEPADPPAEVVQLFADHGRSLYRFCRSTLGNAGDAEDVVQETFLKLLQHLSAGGNRSNLKSWLFTVAANACRNRLRWRVRWLPWQAEHDTRTAEGPDEPLDLDRAHAAMRALPVRDRLLISLRAQGLSYRDIAAASGVRPVSVGRLLARAIDRWKRAVSPDRTDKDAGKRPRAGL
jgi:RNA polymerase sigma-70 factor (ECF subfamily)